MRRRQVRQVGRRASRAVAVTPRSEFLPGAEKLPAELMLENPVSNKVTGAERDGNPPIHGSCSPYRHASESNVVGIGNSKLQTEFEKQRSDEESRLNAFLDKQEAKAEVTNARGEERRHTVVR